jgi:hypothetical protein
MVAPTTPIVRAVFDDDGKPQGLYPEPIWAPDKAPPSAIEIPFAAYLEFLEFQGVRRWDGEKIIPCTPAGPISIVESPLSEEMRSSVVKVMEETAGMHEAIVSAVLCWAGVENSLAHLLDALIPESGMGMAIYYTPTATETRINIVNTSVLHICSQSKIGPQIVFYGIYYLREFHGRRILETALCMVILLRILLTISEA